MWILGCIGSWLFQVLRLLLDVQIGCFCPRRLRMLALNIYNKSRQFRARSAEVRGGATILSEVI